MDQFQLSRIAGRLQPGQAIRISAKDMIEAAQSELSLRDPFAVVRPDGVLRFAQAIERSWSVTMRPDPLTLDYVMAHDGSRTPAKAQVAAESIVDRLRDDADLCRSRTAVNVAALPGQAADEIERLQSVMRCVAAQTTDAWAADRLRENSPGESTTDRAASNDRL